MRDFALYAFASLVLFLLALWGADALLELLLGA